MTALEIYWPRTGETQSCNHVPIDRRLTVNEDEPTPIVHRETAFPPDESGPRRRVGFLPTVASETPRNAGFTRYSGRRGAPGSAFPRIGRVPR